MSSCLGLYIESNVIKYAKVTKERETLKIESFGIKFYEKNRRCNYSNSFRNT